MWVARGLAAHIRLACGLNGPPHIGPFFKRAYFLMPKPAHLAGGPGRARGPRPVLTPLQVVVAGWFNQLSSNEFHAPVTRERGLKLEK